LLATPVRIMQGIPAVSRRKKEEEEKTQPNDRKAETLMIRRLQRIKRIFHLEKHVNLYEISE